MALVVASADVSGALTAIENHVGKDLDPDVRARAERAVDFDADETECPACGTKFAAKVVTRCPDCGLNFGG